MDTLPYIGHNITKDGVQLDLAKIKGIGEMKPPTNSKEVRRFLGQSSKIYFKLFSRMRATTKTAWCV